MSIEDLRTMAQQLAVDAVALDAALQAHQDHLVVPLPNSWYDPSVVVPGSPPPPPGPPPTEGEVWTFPGTTPATGPLDFAGTHHEIKTRLFEMPGMGDGYTPDGYVITSEGFEVTPQGFNVHFDPNKISVNPPPSSTGGANWIDASGPLKFPGTHVRLAYDVVLPADLGKSMKLPGLATVTGQSQVPGGGWCGPNDMIVRPCVSDWNQDGQAWLGPYSYWPWEANKGSEAVMVGSGAPVELWHPTYSGFSLWWYAAPILFAPNQTVHVELEIERSATHWFVVLTLDEIDWIQYRYPITPESPADVSRHGFVIMYGGNTPTYGPAVPTVAQFTDYTVTTLT